MLSMALVFMVVSLTSALFGFTDVAGETYPAARILAFVFGVLFVAALLAHEIDHRDRRRDGP